MRVKSVIIASHFLLDGSSSALRDYLNLKKTSSVIFIGLPFFFQRKQFCEFYKSGRSISRKSSDRKFQLPILDYVIDLLFVLSVCIRQKEKNELFVGVDALNSFAGLTLRRFGKVETVIFYSIDFSPIRFQNGMLNKIYHLIETFCVKHADEVWNVSPRIAEGRQEFLGISKARYPQMVVPIGVWKNKIRRPAFSQVQKHQLLFMGHLLEKQGVQLVMEAIPDIIKKIPAFKFVVVGGGDYDNALRKKVRALGIENHVTFTGWIRDREKLESIMSKSAVAVAVYKPEKEKLYNFSYYADPTKLKDYLSASLPVILTNVSYNAKDLEASQCGIIVPYTKGAVAKAVISLMANAKKLNNFRENAYNKSKEFDWNEIFSKSLSRYETKKSS